MPTAEADTKSLVNAWRKTNEQQLFAELELKYEFPRALCGSFVELIHEYIESNYGNLRNDDQIIYHAVNADERPGKSFNNLSLIPVTLTISRPEDAEILKSRGISGLRKLKLLRFATEAYDQGGLLIQEDLALLLTTSTRTVQRDIREMREEDVIVPTRGSIQYIGSRISQKTMIIELCLKGVGDIEIEKQTRHTGDSIRRYLREFSHVISLNVKDYSSIQIHELTNLPEKVIQEYLTLYEIYKEISPDRLAQILTTPNLEFNKTKGGRRIKH